MAAGTAAAPREVALPGASLRATTSPGQCSSGTVVAGGQRPPRWQVRHGGVAEQELLVGCGDGCRTCVEACFCRAGATDAATMVANMGMEGNFVLDGAILTEQWCHPQGHQQVPGLFTQSYLVYCTTLPVLLVVQNQSSDDGGSVDVADKRTCDENPIVDPPRDGDAAVCEKTLHSAAPHHPDGAEGDVVDTIMHLEAPDQNDLGYAALGGKMVLPEALFQPRGGKLAVREEMKVASSLHPRRRRWQARRTREDDGGKLTAPEIN